MKKIYLHGSWHEMGRQYGELLKEELRHVYEFLKVKADTEKKWNGVVDIAEKLFRHYPAELREFFMGMAETSGFNEEELRIINAVEYSEGAFMCSGLAVWGDYSREGLLYGRNYDEFSFLPLHDDIIVTVYHPEGCQWVSTLGYAGEISALNGINESGLFLELNNGMPSGGFDINFNVCASTAELLMVLFRARTMDDMDRFFCDTRCFASFVIGVADANEARSYEWCQQGCKRGDAETPDGLMIQTNHFVNPEWSFPTPDDSAWCTQTRRCNLRTMADSMKGNIGVSEVQKMMQTTIDDGGPMFLPNDKGTIATHYQFVVSPASRTIWVRRAQDEAWEEIVIM